MPVIRTLEHYYSNGKAWMNNELFSSIVIQFDKELALAGVTRACLLLDNAPSHKVTDLQPKLQVVRLVLLPKNTTAILQPNDQGIIGALKARYKKIMLRKVYKITITNPSEDASKVFSNLKISDALDALHEACIFLLSKPSSLRNCWIKSGLVDDIERNTCSCQASAPMPPNLPADLSDDILDAVSSIDEVLGVLNASFPEAERITAAALLDLEQDFMAHEPVSIAEIINETFEEARLSKKARATSVLCNEAIAAVQQLKDGHIDEGQLANRLLTMASDYTVRCANLVFTNNRYITVISPI